MNLVRTITLMLGIGFLIGLVLPTIAYSAMPPRVVTRHIVHEVVMPPIPAALLSPHAPKLKRIAFLPPVKPRSR